MPQNLQKHINKIVFLNALDYIREIKLLEWNTLLV